MKVPESQVMVGDCRELLRTLEASSVQCCVTSPPYWGLRDYGTGTWKGGSAECRHLGKPRGYPPPRQDTAGAGPDHGRFAATEAAKAVQYRPVRETCSCGALRVDAQLGLEKTPELYVARMVEVFAEVRRVLRDDGTLWLNIGDTYCTHSTGPHRQGLTITGYKARSTPRMGTPDGFKPKDLVGIPWMLAFALRADGWYLRSDIIWHKPNAMPESCTDRPTRAHEYLFLLSKSPGYFYDADAIDEPVTGNAHPRGGGITPKSAPAGRGIKSNTSFNLATRGLVPRRNKRSVWTIPTAPYDGPHFAVMPTALCEPCILAGSRAGDIVLDPFCGSGTVGLVARRRLRRFVGMDLKPSYARMAVERIDADAPLLLEPTQLVLPEGTTPRA